MILQTWDQSKSCLHISPSCFKISPWEFDGCSEIFISKAKADKQTRKVSYVRHAFRKNSPIRIKLEKTFFLPTPRFAYLEKRTFFANTEYAKLSEATKVFLLLNIIMKLSSKIGYFINLNLIFTYFFSENFIRNRCYSLFKCFKVGVAPMHFLRQKKNHEYKWILAWILKLNSKF